MRRAAITLLALLTASSVAAQTSPPIAGPMALLKPSDQARIKNLAASRGKGLELAAGGNDEELRVVR